MVLILFKLRKNVYFGWVWSWKPYSVIQSMEQNKATFWFCWLKFIDRKLSSVMTEWVSNREIRSPASESGSRQYSVQWLVRAVAVSQNNFVQTSWNHSPANSPGRRLASQAASRVESGRKRKAALCLPGSSRQALHRQGLGVQHFGLPDHKELYHDDGLHRLVSCSFRFHFRVRGPLKYGGVRTGELPDSCSGLTTAWPGQLRQLDITVLWCVMQPELSTRSLETLETCLTGSEESGDPDIRHTSQVECLQRTNITRRNFT